MEGRKFSSSRRVVIYVRDFLARYDADALRYFIAVAGPETTDTDFTWAEFLRRNNDELVAGWGNLVNRSISMAAKNFGAIPAAGELTEADRALLDVGPGGFATVGGLIEQHRQKAAIGEAMRVVAEANKYLSDQAPWKIKDEPQSPAGHHPARRAAGGQRLQHAADAVPAALRAEDPRAARRYRRARADAGDRRGGRSGRRPGYPVITGDYTVGARWESVPIEVGRPLAPPKPVFRKLDPSIVEEELARLGGRALTGRPDEVPEHRGRGSSAAAWC